MTDLLTDAQLRTFVKPRNRAATDEELSIFRAVMERTGLSPLSNQLYTIFRTSHGVEKMSVQATIDGFRSIADATGTYLGGSAPQWCDAQGKWYDLWPFDGHPLAARVTVRKAVGAHVGETTTVAHYKEYAPTGSAAQMWERMPSLMLAKVAEALALRRAFPQQLGGLYTGEEMAQAGTVAAPTVTEAKGDPAPARPQPEPLPDETFAALKAAAKGLNWAAIKLAYESLGIRSPDRFVDVFTDLTALEARDLEEALLERQRHALEPTDVPVSDAELAPAPSDPELDKLADEVFGAEPSQEDDVATALGGDPPAKSSSEATTAKSDASVVSVDSLPEQGSRGSGDSETAIGALADAAPAEPAPLVPLPEGSAPIDATLGAAQRAAGGKPLDTVDMALLLEEHDWRLLDLLIAGNTAKACAANLSTSVEEVRAHCARIKATLAVGTIVEVVMLAKSMKMPDAETQDANEAEGAGADPDIRPDDETPGA